MPEPPAYRAAIELVSYRDRLAYGVVISTGAQELPLAGDVTFAGPKLGALMASYRTVLLTPPETPLAISVSFAPLLDLLRGEVEDGFQRRLLDRLHDSMHRRCRVQWRLGPPDGRAAQLGADEAIRLAMLRRS